ncbi:NAD(P)H-hydrate dehydratase [Planctomycetales bacterium ZRK34]|nr:NAD(P)H-hydrate dehydratase [Planctomycetales bacterium ZRK34]
MAAQSTTLPPVPDRPADSHKGTYGTVVVVGGQPHMIGAPALAATAALRTGAGLCKIMTHPEALPHCLTIEPSATGLPTPYLDDEEVVRRSFEQLKPLTVLAVGPGMIESPMGHRGISIILKHKFTTVLDAGGLNNLAAIADRFPQQHCPLVLTPHPGEFGRLARAIGIKHDPTDPDARPAAAAALAKHFGAIVVLKGHHTVVSDGQQHYVNQTGNPALATAGSGDILTGVIASLIAQGMGLYDAAVLGVYLHGLAADFWANDNGPVGMTARDLANLIPAAIKQHRNAM